MVEWHHVVAFGARVAEHDVFVRQHPRGWEVWIDGEAHLVRNRHYRTWITARPIIERVIRASLEGAEALHSSGRFTGGD